MTKSILFGAGVLGMVVLANAQNVVPSSPFEQMRANVEKKSDTVQQLRGSVEIVLSGGEKIFADEADRNPQTGVVELRGNVRLVPPDRK